MEEIPSPADLGAPEQYTAWRAGQDRVMRALMMSERRFDVAALPTGVGKSLLGTTVSRYQGARALVLTRTKPLQDQYTGDGLVDGDVRGMNAYPCQLLLDERAGHATCDNGPCLDGLKCRYRDVGCDYYDAVRAAQGMELPVTNYSFWLQLHRSKKDGALGSRDLLICDEAHDVPAAITDFLRVELTTKEVIGLPEKEGEGWDAATWTRWCHEQKDKVTVKMRDVSDDKRRELKEVLTKLDTVISYGDRPWVAEYRQWGVSGGTTRTWVFEPLWPAPYAEEWLWRGVPKVLLMSATITPKALELAGLPKGSYGWHAAPSPFPAGRRPVIHVSTIALNSRTHPSMLGLWMARIDQIVGGRLDRKGIIHSVSYDRAKYIVEHSEHREHMILPSARNTAEAVAEFKRCDPPAILVSPAVHTGYDFPMEECEYIIIPKVPFPDMRGALGEARRKSDRTYEHYLAATTIVQAAGRGVRGPGDYAETFIVDDSIVWMMSRYREFFPSWFRDAYRSERSIPGPGAKL